MVDAGRGEAPRPPMRIFGYGRARAAVAQSASSKVEYLFRLYDKSD